MLPLFKVLRFKMQVWYILKCSAMLCGFSPDVFHCRLLCDRGKEIQTIEAVILDPKSDSTALFAAKHLEMPLEVI